MALSLAAGLLGGALIGGVSSALGAHSAAKAQTSAANQATAAQQAMYNQTRSDLLPYQQFGQSAGNQLMARMGEFTSPMSMTQDQLEQTPGYQFTKTQGLKTVNNALGARGLLNSGAVMKGAADFATGLADKTYLDQFNMDQTLKQNNYNRLLGATQLGENAAAQTGAYGTQTAQSVGSNIIGAGNARAAADMATANAFGSAGNALTNLVTLQNAPKLLAGIYGRPN
jgi:hypothetical protein